MSKPAKAVCTHMQCKPGLVKYTHSALGSRVQNAHITERARSRTSSSEPITRARQTGSGLLVTEARFGARFARVAGVACRVTKAERSEATVVCRGFELTDVRQSRLRVVVKERDPCRAGTWRFTIGQVAVLKAAAEGHASRVTQSDRRLAHCARVHPSTLW